MQVTSSHVSIWFDFPASYDEYTALVKFGNVASEHVKRAVSVVQPQFSAAQQNPSAEQQSRFGVLVTHHLPAWMSLHTGGSRQGHPRYTGAQQWEGSGVARSGDQPVSRSSTHEMQKLFNCFVLKKESVCNFCAHLCTLYYFFVLFVSFCALLLFGSLCTIAHLLITFCTLQHTLTLSHMCSLHFSHFLHFLNFLHFLTIFLQCLQVLHFFTFLPVVHFSRFKIYTFYTFYILFYTLYTFLLHFYCIFDIFDIFDTLCLHLFFTHFLTLFTFLKFLHFFYTFHTLCTPS